MTTTSKNRIMIHGPMPTALVVEFRTAAGEALAISIPRTEAAVIRHFLRIARQMLVDLFHDPFSSAKASRKQRWNCLRVTCHFFRSASSSNHIMHSKPS